MNTKFEGRVSAGREVPAATSFLTEFNLRSASEVSDAGFEGDAPVLNELEAHILDYALALNEQISTLIRTYEDSLSRWKFERAALLARCQRYEQKDSYVAQLERDLLLAWEQLENQAAGPTQQPQALRELEIAAKNGAEREKRLTIELARARQLEKNARQDADAAQKACEAQKLRAESEARRANAAAAERDRLAQRYSEASRHAERIAKNIAELESEMSGVIAEKDARIRELTHRLGETTRKERP
jgi:hypothetical protein